MEFWGDALSPGTALFLVLAIALALAFEFVNGFHDTANAVATVIYTHSLKPTQAVVWSGCWNLIGVLFSSGAVAFAITSLLPVDLVLNVGSAAGFAMVFSLLISAMVWNLGTWYLGLPASSSHTLIGSIMGVGLAHSLLSPNHGWADGVNWAKAAEIGSSLLISPLVGFTSAALLLFLFKRYAKSPELYRPPEGEKAPPGWIRGLLILTCTGVSFAHGSNDGQKGMGLIMLILVGVLPGAHAVNIHAQRTDLQELLQASAEVNQSLQLAPIDARNASLNDAEQTLAVYLKTGGAVDPKTNGSLALLNRRIATALAGKSRVDELDTDSRRELRGEFYLVSETIAKMDKSGALTPEQKKVLPTYKTKVDKFTRYIPGWVKVAVALSLGLGTMIGWKRIVVTVGEKIGKEHLNYGQGASAELVAMSTIGLADFFGLPVSTTHVLSSGVAGTMAANGSGVQIGTIRSLAIAWLLTLPVCVFLGALLFSLGLNVVLALGLH